MEYKVLIAGDCFGSREDAARILKCRGMRLFFCGRNGAEILKRIEEVKPDAVVMNAVLHKMDGFAVLSRTRDMARAPKFVLLYSGCSDEEVEKAEEMGAARCFELPVNRYYLASELEAVCLRAEIDALRPLRDRPRDFEEETAVMLHLLAIPANVKGYQYLREAVLLSLRSKSSEQLITKEIYPTVARRFGTTPLCVERAIRHAIESAWNRGDAEELYAFFGNTIRPDRGKPTNSEFIFLVAEKLRTSAT